MKQRQFYGKGVRWNNYLLERKERTQNTSHETRNLDQQRDENCKRGGAASCEQIASKGTSQGIPFAIVEAFLLEPDLHLAFAKLDYQVSQSDVSPSVETNRQTDDQKSSSEIVDEFGSFTTQWHDAKHFRDGQGYKVW
eukprot:CAMPEP_0174275172 /NCGR_PEP_ID=MMETSP0439-20130205/59682_1 /TAXON_ID=0 /ORGANISM="Stereomyxa ramosa, Strain Chinc5" /LENGTH=137 /DNA_ID=CAMNT_0015367253 /DNA_START=882 /DNA_END=1292 /DNA_ORIENTATION=-